MNDWQGMIEWTKEYRRGMIAGGVRNALADVIAEMERRAASQIQPAAVVIVAPVVIRELTLTCGACPTQYEGTTVDGRGVYIRYRWGRLDVHIGTDVDDAIGNTPMFKWQNPDSDMDGVMTEDQLRERVPAWIVLPDTF